MSGAFAARWHGICSDCEDRIEPGQEVAYVEGALEHVECRPRIEDRSRPVCETCWLTKPCDCEADR